MRSNQGFTSDPTSIMPSQPEVTILELAEAVRKVVEKVQKEKSAFAKRAGIIHKEVSPTSCGSSPVLPMTCIADPFPSRRLAQSP